jgi:hypothetical protein
MCFIDPYVIFQLLYFCSHTFIDIITDSLLRMQQDELLCTHVYQVYFNHSCYTLDMYVHNTVCTNVWFSELSRIYMHFLFSLYEDNNYTNEACNFASTSITPILFLHASLTLIHSRISLKMKTLSDIIRYHS